jgi:hypothetical protein
VTHVRKTVCVSMLSYQRNVCVTTRVPGRRDRDHTSNAYYSITKTVYVCPPHMPERILQRGGGARTVQAEYQPEVTRTETDKQRGGQ